MPWHDHKLTITISSALIGAVCATASNYFITKDKIRQEFETWQEQFSIELEKEFADWQKKLDIQKEESERKRRVDQLERLSLKFKVSMNQISQLKTVLHDYSMNAALHEFQPDAIFAHRSDASKLAVLNSMEANIRNALSQKSRIEEQLAHSDAEFFSIIESMSYTHEELCVKNLPPVVEAHSLETGEISVYVEKMREFVDSNHRKWKTEYQLRLALRDWDELAKLMDWSTLDQAFTLAFSECHTDLSITLNDPE